VKNAPYSLCRRDSISSSPTLHPFSGCCARLVHHISRAQIWSSAGHCSFAAHSVEISYAANDLGYGNANYAVFRGGALFVSAMPAGFPCFALDFFSFQENRMFCLDAVGYETPKSIPDPMWVTLVLSLFSINSPLAMFPMTGIMSLCPAWFRR